MKPLLDFLTHYKTDKKEGLICGKGPSLDTLSNYDISPYLTMSINDVVRSVPMDIAHAIDWDVVDRCGKAIYNNAKVLVMPYHPHIGFQPNEHITLEDWSAKHPILSKLREEGRLFGYNLSTIDKTYNHSPVIDALYFTSEASVNLMGHLGIKTIRTLGIDGGKARSSQFNDLHFENKERGYDAQWVGIRKAIKRFTLNFAPLGIVCPIRVFIGAGPQQLIPALVLKHSILKNASMSVDVTIMNDWTHPMPRDPKNWPRTPFSFQRFMIPERCNKTGDAIYLDSDMLVFSDIKEFWTAPNGFTDIVTPLGKDIDKHKAQFSAMKLNCDRLAYWDIKEIVDEMDKGKLTYEQLVFEMNEASVIMDKWNPDWNSLEEYMEGKTKLLHYTEMYNQPWLVNPNHPLAKLWFDELTQSVSDGDVDRQLIIDHVNKRWIRPECLVAIK